jgi:hypothetical protein
MVETPTTHEEPCMNRPLLPFPRLARLALLAPAMALALAAGADATPSAAAPAAAPAHPPAATGAARQSAEALFNRYVDLEHAFDPALVDLYADEAHIQSRVIVPGRPPTVRNWSGTEYKELLRRALAKAKETGKDLNYYSAVTYLREGSRVRIRAVRYAEMQKAVSPMELLVGPAGAGSWRIFEELSESHPLMAAPPAPRPKP